MRRLAVQALPVVRRDAIMRMMGVKGRVRIHNLRDTFAYLLLRGNDEFGVAGVDIRTVAELIGDTPEVCLKRYCHTNEKT